MMPSALPVLMLAAACGLTSEVMAPRARAPGSEHAGVQAFTAELAAYLLESAHPPIPLAKAHVFITQIDWRQAQDASARQQEPQRESPAVRARGPWTRFLGAVVGGNAGEDAKVGGKLNASLEIDGTALRPKRGGWFVKYGAQQFLRQDAANPARGWGVFGHIGAWDANPTPMQWSATLGVGGSPPLASRPRDRFGIGCFRSSFSQALRDGLAPILRLDDEQGVEAFYTAEVVRRLRITGHVQLIDSAIRGVDRAVAIGLRTRVMLD